MKHIMPVQQASIPWAKLSRFAGVGILNSFVYAIATTMFVRHLAWNPTLASIAGYVVAVPLAFVAHRVFTFSSNGKVSFELPRFVAVHVLGIGVSWLVMVLAAEWLRLHYAVGIVAAIVLVPVLSYVILDRHVFRGGR